jgi:hypothetical protein
MSDDEGAVRINLSPGEIISPSTRIEIHSARPIDPRSAQGAIRVDGLRASVALASRRRVAWLSVQRLQPGAYHLTVDELLDARGGKLVDFERIPFLVVEMPSGMPSRLRVEHMTRLRIEDTDVLRLDPFRFEAPFVDLYKAVERRSGKPVELAFDHEGKPVNAARLLADVAARRFERFGRIHETLFAKLSASKPNERIPIAVWAPVDVDPFRARKPTDLEVDEPPAFERELDAVVRKAVTSLRRSLGRAQVKVSGAEPAAPVVYAEATSDQIRRIAAMDAVGVVLFDDRTAILDLDDSIAVARSNAAHALGFDGTGVNVAVWENGPDVTTNLSIAGRYTTSPSTDNHSRLTHGIIKNIEPNEPHGHAPDCNLFSANSYSTDALRWAARDRLCTVISQSFHRSTEPGNGTLQSDDLLKDWLALRSPYPTIVMAAGNFWQGDADNITPPADEFVNHKSFNTLTVGNHNDAADAMSGDSVFRNPTSSHGDRELPELTANGTGVTAVGRTSSGTSFAAPAVAGIAALLQEADGVLKAWPEGCRAILLAAARRNVSAGTWWNDVVADVDASDGAGSTDAAEGVAIARQRRSRNATATRRGWDIGTLRSADFGGDRLATFRYRVEVPFLLFAPHVKVAIAWDSKVTSTGETATASTLTVDFDLLVRTAGGVQVAQSSSWDNSYEVAEFDAARGAVYEIVIRRWSGTDSVWFGIAWTVTGFSYFDRFEELELSRRLSFPR